MSAKRAARARVRVERLIGQRDGARLTIDRLYFDLTQDDLVQLGVQLLGLLGSHGAGVAARAAQLDAQIADNNAARKRLEGRR